MPDPTRDTVDGLTRACVQATRAFLDADPLLDCNDCAGIFPISKLREWTRLDGKAVWVCGGDWKRRLDIAKEAKRARKP